MGGTTDADVLARAGATGWRGLFQNGKVVAITLFSSVGGVLYGYNQGVFGQVQVMENFVDRYYLELNSDNVARRGLLTAILELGAFLGAFMAGPLADAYSRKYSLSAWCFLFMVGVAIQTGADANPHAGCIYAGRWFAGMGVGAISMLVPMYNAELAPPGIRGSLVSLQQLAITFGILVSYWIAYGTNYIGGVHYDRATHTGQSTAAWRLPLSLQLVPGAFLCIGALFLPFSPRWLMLKGREDECLTTLANLRGGDPSSPEIQYEFRALQAERLVEREIAKERYGYDDVNFKVSLGEYHRLLTSKPLLRRLLIGASAQALQQWTGINAIIYYAPSIFREIGLTGPTTGLLATGVVGIVNFVLTIPAVLFVDNFGRKPILIWGMANMAVSHATVGAIVATYGGRFDEHKAAGNGAVFMVFWFIANFAVTWGPLAWVVSSEVWPLDMRAKGMSISSATNWIMNFTVAMITPVMFKNIGYKTYMVFMCFCIVGLLFSIFIVPELKGLSLEEVDHIFGDDAGAKDQQRRDRIAHEIGLDKLASDIVHKEQVHGPAGGYDHNDVEKSEGKPKHRFFQKADATGAAAGPPTATETTVASEPPQIR
ncbi:hypothetical protein Q8F55_001081 [Vanrija albida]|uniref:Major facilitator superfamily (MFS) profile domain-containing protein n=1 Tax=Vanrija albida TaxID=181172 RepID=A0ABR3QF93_9TREE